MPAFRQIAQIIRVAQLSSLPEDPFLTISILLKYNHYRFTHVNLIHAVTIWITPYLWHVSELQSDIINHNNISSYNEDTFTSRTGYSMDALLYGCNTWRELLAHIIWHYNMEPTTKPAPNNGENTQSSLAAVCIKLHVVFMWFTRGFI